MKCAKRLYKNALFAFSAGAYFLLAVPASVKGLAAAIILTGCCSIFGSLRSDVREQVQRNVKKRYWIISVMLCALMGCRFDEVWKNAQQLKALFVDTQSTCLFLRICGCALAIGAVSFVVSMLTLLLEYPFYGIRQYEQKTDHPKWRLSQRLSPWLLPVLILQMLVLIFAGMEKQGFHVDEVYSFELANYPDTVYGDSENAYVSWKDGAVFSQILQPADGREFDLSVPFWNGETDNHPSTYYMMINILSSVNKVLGQKVNKWIGLIPNIILCLFVTYVLSDLLMKLLNNRILSVCGAACWALSIGGINTAVYIRMYAMMTAVLIAFCWSHWYYIKSVRNGSPYGLDLMLIQRITIAGVLSQYYFLVFAFAFCSIVCIMLFARKEYRTLYQYVIAEICAVFAAELLFPRMIARLFFGDRGSAAVSSIFGGKAYLEHLLRVCSMLNTQVFGGNGIGIVLLCTFSIVLFWIFRRKRIQNEEMLSNEYIAMLSSAVLGYILLIARIAPYQVDRYYMAMFPVIVLVVLYWLTRYLSLPFFRRNRKGVIVLSVLMLGFTCMNTLSGNVNYLYPEGKQRIETLAEYVDLPVVAVNGDSYDDSILQWSFEFAEHEDVFLCRSRMLSDVAGANECGLLDDGFLLYVHQEPMGDDEVFELIGQYMGIQSYSKIADTQNCRVFCCNREKR